MDELCVNGKHSNDNHGKANNDKESNEKVKFDSGNKTSCALQKGTF